MKTSRFLPKASAALALSTALSLTLTSSSSQSAQLAKSCVDLFTTISSRVGQSTGLIKNASSDYTRRLAYPKGVDPKRNPEGHFEVAYESEYTFDETGPLLRDYVPRDIPKERWLNQMTDQQRIQWLKDKFQDKPEFAEGSGLFKIVDLPFMPNELLIDSTGNAEIVLDKMSTEGEWMSTIDTIVARYGAGSQQAMISKPRQAAYPLGASPERQRELTNQHKGWQIYTNLFDMYAKMRSGYERYQKDPSKMTALSFDHPFVGPMNKIKRDVMEEYMDKNAAGEKYDDEAKQFVRKSDASFKYTSGPSYRPDIAGPWRYAWELRNSHKDVQDLKNKLHRDLVAHQKGLEPYAIFSRVPAFDSIKTFASLPQGVQQMLAKLFPSKADPRFEYDENQKRVLETYRNFAIPMQDMSRLVVALTYENGNGKVLMSRVREAQSIYLSRLNDTMMSLENGSISAGLAKARIMGAIGEFAVSSGLDRAFETKAIEMGHDGGDFDSSLLRDLNGQAVQPAAALPKAG